jgi:hypothetical protein
MKYLKRFNEASFDRIEEFIKLADKIINYDESEFEQGDEPSNTDILSELGDLCNELTFTSEELQQVINSGRISDPNKFLQIILDDTLRDEEDMENDETPAGSMKKFVVTTTSESSDHYIYFIEHPTEPTKDELKRFLQENGSDVDEDGTVYENVDDIKEIKDFQKIPQ